MKFTLERLVLELGLSCFIGAGEMLLLRICLEAVIGEVCEGCRRPGRLTQES